ncbi:methionine ABC transporter ATP-binding protein [Clostridium estertheticum]|uniref:Methionine ABC transporter ATP-binding protein n=2 Tax=Clostridium estertheticum TaxID=238834 RepID=A0A1J0GLT3_9CLOT|nr:methionine ABC transporter ATP-binding protein [Clostridium estertheticum]APC42265.1 methionine ABC transporter ATP-binding protein [Clostridium estertheticum subsp. estertheticum]MBU3172224.1 methionine ABC transporter ATP-binding protein [Clostridium estertheticum]MBU3186384.1 methionine ABC transporter ATP-binding protein [Clostridium estertheticum]MBZ9615805.1 methionine ABC transporter ATP-binding protein [Clostridium estertheticum subsp. laramiense]MCB2341361.1 methionine ABC transpor
MIKVSGVSKSFSEVKVLSNVSFTVDKGDIYGVIGHSGAGKSTLLRCFNGLETYDTGTINIMGKVVNELSRNELREFRKDVGIIFQSFNLINSKNVFDNIAFPLEVWGNDKSYIKERVDALIDLVGLNDKVKTNVKQLSGGQKQRVGIARALALNPKILLCDEATSALDPKTTKSILQLLRDINNKFNITIVVVTHQMEVVKEICNKFILLEGGKIKSHGFTDELFIKPTKEMKILIGEEELLPSIGYNIKIFFTKEITQSCLITSLARELEIDFSIVWGRLEKFRDSVMGSLIINTNEENKEKILKYLDDRSIEWEINFELEQDELNKEGV